MVVVKFVRVKGAKRIEDRKDKPWVSNFFKFLNPHLFLEAKPPNLDGKLASLLANLSPKEDFSRNSFVKADLVAWSPYWSDEFKELLGRLKILD